MLQAAIAVDTFVVSLALVATRDPGSVYAFYYLWVGLYAVCFFRMRLVAIHASMGAWDPATSWRYEGLPLHRGAQRAFREAGAMPA